MVRSFHVGLLVCLFLWVSVWANQVSYQGILTNSAGDSLLSGTYDFSFSIYPVATGGTPRWAEPHPGVVVQNGVYSVMLGTTTPLPDSIGVSNWLQIAVNTVALTPRLPITADFRAIEARHAQNSDSVNHIGARATPTANHLVPLDATGRFPESVLPFTLDSILAGQGLTGSIAAPESRDGRNTLDERLTLSVGAGTGITVTADQVAAVLGTTIATAEIEDNAVTSAKVQDNTLTAADALTNIVSMVDSVTNDGGNIDLIAGTNITITPNDANNTITIAATGGGGGYSAGTCIALAGTVIHNTMSITSGDSCIRVVFDPNTCTYQLSSDLDVYAGDCIEVEYDDVTCDWTVSVDPACFDSVYDTEIYAESFVVTDDGTLEGARAHFTSDGELLIYDANGITRTYIGPYVMGIRSADSTVASEMDSLGVVTGKVDGTEYIRLNNDGTWTAVQGGQDVAGLDSNGESYAKSFYVRDPATGDTLIHLTQDGEINLSGELFGEPYSALIRSDLVSVQGPRGTTSVGDGIIQVYRGGPPTDGTTILEDGTWVSFQNSQTVAGVDSTGEMFAKSFYVPNPQGGEPLIHLTNDGQILRNGIPIAGGEGDTIRRIDPNDSMFIGAFGLELYNSLSQGSYRADSMRLGHRDGNDAFSIFSDGCFKSTQGGETVAGVDVNGEVFAKSFYILNASGDTIAHMKSDGSLVLFDPSTSKYIIVDPSVLQIGNNAANSGARMFPDGSIEVAQDSVVTAGVQPNGEIHAKSFEVRDSAGGAIKTHLTSDGFIDMQGDEFTSNLGPDGLTVTDNVTGREFEIGPNGWEARDDEFFAVAGVDSTGEIYAKSFEVRDVAGGEIKTHITNDGFIEMQGDGFATNLGPDGLTVTDNGTGREFEIGPNGWEARDGNLTAVAGVDSTGEIFAKSFEVRDSADGALIAHLDNSGNLALPNGAQITVGGVPLGGGEGAVITRSDGSSESSLGASGISTEALDGSSGVALYSNGTMLVAQGSQIVAGIDEAGEAFAKSFYVKDPATGDTLLHITSTGQIVDATGAALFNGTQIVRAGASGDANVGAGTVSVSEGFVGTGLSMNAVTAADFGSGNIMQLNTNGTWEAQRGFLPIAALDTTGEIIAKSFEVRDSVTGVTKAHLTNDGNLALPEGAQITIGGVPIGGGIGDQIEFEDGSNSSFLDAEGLAVTNGTVSNTAVTGTNVAVANDANTSYMDMQYDGTWEAKQNGVIVSSLQPNGEIHAKSFEVRDSAGGVIKAHLTNAGGLTAIGTLSGQYVTGTTSVYSQNINGSTTLFSDLSPGSLRSQTLVSNVQTAGWAFLNNGTMTQWVDPPGVAPPMLNMSTTNDGYWQFGMPVFFGNPANFNYLSGGTVNQGVMTSGNMTINGKANVTGLVDPIICEAFPVHPNFSFVPGTVVVADRNSDYIIPCDDVAQTSVIGVIAPDEKVDERGHILVTIMGYAASFKEDGTRLEMRVKADAKYGAIRRGDLLTTSATPGHAMLASDPKLGTIVGKALESLESGTGEIKVMVTLQ